jgi:5-methylcytosine-specific restriction endonuclease McrA
MGESKWAAERRRVRQRAWRLANREKVVADAKLYAAEHADERRVYSSVLRAVQLGVLVNDFDIFDWQELLVQWDNTCAYCCSRERIELEHKTPFARGGANTKSNIVPACRTCNQRKHTRTVSEFLAVA